MNNSLNRLYQFGPFRLDTRERLLFREEERISLTPKAFDTLLILVERHGHIVEKDELIRNLWPDTVVEENNLMQNIHSIRKALSDNSDGQQYIETLPRRGYRFIAKVEETSNEITERNSSQVIQSEIPETSTAVSPRPQFAVRPLVSLLIVIVILGLGTIYVSRSMGVGETLETLRPEMKLSRLTTTSNAWEPAISPDGKLIAYILGDAGQQSLKIKPIGTSVETEIFPAEELRYRGLTFSPDGTYIYFAQKKKDESEFTLYKIPYLGGEKTRLMAGVDSAVTFSPDGKKIAFIRENALTGESKLLIANEDGSEEKVLASRKTPDFFSVDGPSWSGDGYLVATGVKISQDGFHYRILAVDLRTGQEKFLGNDRWDWVSKIAWLNDNKNLVLLGRINDQGTNKNQIWQVDSQSGKLRRIINDLNDYRGLAVDKENHRLVSIQSESRANLWRITATDSANASQITDDSANQTGNDGLDITPDSKIVYTSFASGHKDLWLIDPQTKQTRQITNHYKDNAASPSITNDGQRIIFNSGRSGTPRICSIDFQGGNLKELNYGNLDLHPFCSAFSDKVFFSSEKNGNRTIWKTNTDLTAQPQPLIPSNISADYPVISPDGKLVAFLYQENSKASPQIAIFSLEEKSLKQKIKIESLMPSSIRWHPDGKSLTYLTRKDSNKNIWSQSLKGGEPKQLTTFNSDRIFSYAWSRDGRWMGVSRGLVNRDVVMIEGFN